MLKRIVLSSTVVLALGLAACDEVPTTGPASDAETEFDPTFDVSGPPDGGTCPDVFYEESRLLSNGVTVMWTSVLAGFDYTEGEDYMADVNWSVDLGTATFVSFTERNGRNTWTPPRDVDGLMTPGAAGDGTVPVTVSMFPMHAAGEGEDDDDDGDDDWTGQIGNGHFWLRLEIANGDEMPKRVKLGVNFHLEDPADGYGSRCPGDEPVGNQPPTADGGLDQTVTDTDDGGDEDVTLDGSGSSDDGTIVSYVWTESAVEIATGVNPLVTFAVGEHTVTLTVTDDEGATDTDVVVITVDPAPPAAISFAADIQPYFEAGQANCVQCHSGGSGQKGVNLDSYANIMAGGDDGPLVVPGDSNHPDAILVPQLEGNHQNGPDDAGFVVILKQWINAGADDN